MMTRLAAYIRRRRVESQAYTWVVRIDEDRARHEPGLRQWIGNDQDRADTYNRAYRAFKDAAGPAASIYGNARQRGAIARSSGVRAIPSPSLLAAAAAIVLFGIAVAATISLLGRSLQPPAVSSGQSVGSGVVATAVGEVRTLKLADGSQLILDTDTRILVRFTNAKRSVALLRGRARFDVAHHSVWPFVVMAGGGTITARGTVFDVAAFDRIGVHLISGAIDVRLPMARGTIAPRVDHLHSGQQVSFVPNHPNSEVPLSPTAQTDAQWVTGRRTFDDVAVGEIVEEANRYTLRKIVLASAETAREKVFLDVDIRDPLVVAHKLAALLHLRVDDRTDVIELTPVR